jgi:hypothetical protein
MTAAQPVATGLRGTTIVERLRSSAHPWRFPLVAWAVWRAAHLALFLATGPPTGRWDEDFYLKILRHGYAPVDDAVHQQTNFFPLLPWTTRAVQEVVRSEAVACNLVVTAAQIATVVLLFAFVRNLRGERTARLSVALLLAAPASVFLWFFYSEGLYLALSIGALAAASRDRPALAGILGAAVAMTRTLGVTIALPLALVTLRRRRRLDGAVLWAAVPALGVLVVMLFQWWQAGDPLAFVHASKAWGTSTTLPTTTYLHRFRVLDDGGLRTAFVDVAAMTLALVLAYRAGRSWLPLPLVVWSWLALLGPLTAGLMFSWHRYAYAAWPLVVFAADALTRRPRWVTAGVFAVLASVTVERILAWHDRVFIG